MNDFVKCIIFAFVFLSGSVSAMSESEQGNYPKIKSRYDEADKKLNEIYVIQIK